MNTKIEHWFTWFAEKASDYAGRPSTFVFVTLSVLLWAITGPYYNYSDTWQLVINTSTTIITCLLAFLIQASANRAELASQTKLDELINSDLVAHKEMVGIEHLTLSELNLLKKELERAVKERREGV